MDELEEVKWKIRRLLKMNVPKGAFSILKQWQLSLGDSKRLNKQGHAMCSPGKQCIQRKSDAVFKTSESSIFYRVPKLRNKRSEVRLKVKSGVLKAYFSLKKNRQQRCEISVTPILLLQNLLGVWFKPHDRLKFWLRSIYLFWGNLWTMLSVSRVSLSKAPDSCFWIDIHI